MGIPLKYWWMAFRPKTLTAALAPVMIGTAMAYGDGLHHFPSAWICLATAVAVQVGTNLANDYFDGIKGTDNSERIGPTRVTQAGLIPAETVKLSFIIAFFLTAVGCGLLVLRAGWTLAIVGIVSILSGLFYTAGKKPLGYLGLGEIFVLVFFGPVAVGGTYFVQTFEINYAVILAGLAPGLISVGILAVNNYRDIDGDRQSSKKTLAVRFGRTFAQYEYLLAMTLAAIIPIIIFMNSHFNHKILWSTFIIFPSLIGFQRMLTSQEGKILNSVLGLTGFILLLYSIIFSIGWIL